MWKFVFAHEQMQDERAEGRGRRLGSARLASMMIRLYFPSQMEDRETGSPLTYESKADFKRRRRLIVLSDLHREVIRFALWMIGLLIAGLAFGAIISLPRQVAS